MEATKLPINITIICPPCHICERIKILCTLCEFKMNNNENADNTPNTYQTIFILEPTNFHKTIWKIKINLSYTENNKTKQEIKTYEAKEKFVLPEQEKEFLIYLNELKNLVIKNIMVTNHKNSHNEKLTQNQNQTQNTSQHLFSQITKSNYEKQIMVFSSTTQTHTTLILCIEIAQFLATRNQKVCIVDYTTNNELYSFTGNKYAFQINNNHQNILIEKLFENTPTFYTQTHSKGTIQILGNHSLKTLPYNPTKFLETLYEHNDYVLVNTGIYKTELENIYNKYNHILNTQNTILDNSFLKQILLDDIKISHLVSFNKNNGLLQKIAETTNIPLAIFKPIKIHKTKIMIKQTSQIPFMNQKDNKKKQTITSTPKIRINKTYDTKTVHQKLNMWKTNNKEKTYMNICALNKSYPHF